MSDLNILFIEDSEDDYFFLKRHLKKHGISFNSHWVFLKNELINCFESGLSFDVVLCDHALPDMDSFKALEIVKRYSSVTSFIVVSQAIGEYAAVRVMKAGADDCIMKNDLAMLTPAIQTAIDKKKQYQLEHDAQLNYQKANFAIANSIVNPVIALQNLTESFEGLAPNKQKSGIAFRIPEIMRALKSYTENLADLVKVNTAVVSYQQVNLNDALDGAIEVTGADMQVICDITEEHQLYTDYFLLKTAIVYILKLFKSHFDYHCGNNVAVKYQVHANKCRIALKYSGSGLDEFSVNDIEKSLESTNNDNYENLLHFYVAKCAVEKLSGEIQLYTSHNMGTLVSLLFKRKPLTA